MIFAVIPWAERFNNNELFDAQSETNKNGLTEPYAEMKEYIEKAGHEINTVDMYRDLSEVDFFLFFDWFENWMDMLIQLGYSNKMVYCNAEPATVRRINSPEGYKEVCKYFPYIMTWNKDIIDNKTFFYRTIPYNFGVHYDTVSFSNKKLLTSISANKKSDYRNELYTERERLISFFETKIPEQFDMYGVGWENSGHSSYKGRPTSKFDTYRNYRFALAFENTRGVKGYVTEKIFDCLTGNVVPVYFGAEDICDYVSKDCFIDYRDYGSPQELLDYIISVDEEKYNGYLVAARVNVERLKNRGDFSGARYGQNIIDMSMKATKTGFIVDSGDAKSLHASVQCSRVKKKVKSIIKRVLGDVR